MRSRRRERDLARRAPQRVRHAARRPAAHAQRARRPVHRVRSGDRARDAPGARLRRGGRRRRARPRFRRLATAIAKYHVCKRGPGHAFEALECLGGNGYVEESGMPRLYREMPLVVDLGGLGQRHGARRPARADPDARGARRLLRRARRGRRRRRAPGRVLRAAARRARRSRGDRAARAPARRGDGARAAGRAARAPRASRPSPTRSARPAWPATAGSHYGTLPAGVDAKAIVDRHTPPDAGPSRRAHARARRSPSLSSRALRPLRRVGLAAEHASPEDPDGTEVRVALTPAAIAAWWTRGRDVAVEAGAGERMGFADDEYRAAGAAIVSRDGSIATATSSSRSRARRTPTSRAWTPARCSSAWRT